MQLLDLMRDLAAGLTERRDLAAEDLRHAFEPGFRFVGNLRELDDAELHRLAGPVHLIGRGAGRRLQIGDARARTVAGGGDGRAGVGERIHGRARSALPRARGPR